jgi:hypothetical protein
MMLRDEQGVEWTLLGTFGGGELAFVCELFADENVPFRTEPLPPQVGIVRGFVWIAASEHARAVALLTEAQAEAESAAQRETAAIAAEDERAAEAAARDAEAAAEVAATASRHAAHAAARQARQDARRHQHPRAQPDASEGESYDPDPAADRAVRFVAVGLVAFILLIGLIFAIGERYGTHRPTPGRDVKAVYCPHGGTSCIPNGR